MTQTKRELLVKKARKHYIFFLKYTIPKCEEYPANLLQMLNHSRERWVRLKNSING